MNEDALNAVEFLQKGKIILYPTDTVWGIGCDATDDNAVKKIYKIKRRSDSKSMIVLVDSIEMLNKYVDSLEKSVIDIINTSRRPTTVIIPGAKGLAQALVAADGSVGFRVSRDEFSASLCRFSGSPVVSTSANISGEPTAHNYSEISEEIKDSVDYICMTRREDSEPHLPSRIVKLENDNSITIIRD